MTAFATLSPYPLLPFRYAAYYTVTSLCRLPRTRSLYDFAAFAFGNVIWSVLFAALCLPFLRPLLLSLIAALLRFHCSHLCVCVFQVNGKRTRNSQHATATTTTTYVANILFFPYPLIPPFATLLASPLACLSLRVVRFLVLVLYFILFYCSCIFCFFLLLLFWAVSTLLCFTSSANLLLLLRQRGGSERRRVTLCVCAWGSESVCVYVWESFVFVQIPMVLSLLFFRVPHTHMQTNTCTYTNTHTHTYPYTHTCHLPVPFLSLIVCACLLLVFFF